MTRQLLPNRRWSEIATFELDGTRFRATISRFNGREIGEIFIDTDKPCNAVAIAARDIGIAASLALQSGCPAETLRKHCNVCQTEPRRTACRRARRACGGQPMSVILGIDIGASGAIALLTREGELIDVYDMPVLADGPKGRRSVNAPLLASIIFKSHADHAFVEFVGARPGEGAVGAFAFGRSRGVIEGVLGAAGIPCTLIAPASWKRAVGLSRPARTLPGPKQSGDGRLNPSASPESKMMEGRNWP